MQRLTCSENETRAIGEALGRRLGPGDVVCLVGPLGAGKTTLAQGIARGLDVEDVVNSPTFTLVQEYAGRLTVYHIDAYRLSGPEEAADLAIPEMIEAGGVLLIEWPERIEPVLPTDRLEIQLEPAGDDRRITASEGGARSRTILEQIARELPAMGMACRSAGS
jgi:tRNA threonylcarbamoyladenosine biosynthesis protein TsaE